MKKKVRAKRGKFLVLFLTKNAPTQSRPKEKKRCASAQKQQNDSKGFKSFAGF